MSAVARHCRLAEQPYYQLGAFARHPRAWDHKIEACIPSYIAHLGLDV
jgi:hypothetical protein